MQTPERQEDVTKGWKEVKATVLRDHEIPDRVANRIPVRVPDATVGSFDWNSSIQRLTAEYTLSTVREGHVTDALVVNITGGPVRIKHEILLGKCLAYNLKVVPVPLEFPTACVFSVHKSSVDTELGQPPTLRSVVNVVDYPEMKHSLLELLERFRDAIALPGKSLGVTDRTVHHIRLKPGTQPVYVASFRLPHSQKAIVDEMIQDMLDQGVIQNSRSPWNSGHYEWLRMPSRLKSAPLTFQRLINDIFAGMLSKTVFAYFDDIIVASKDPDTHLDNLKLLFQKLQEAGLKVKLTKC